MATYGEGEPTDNAVTLIQNLRDEEFSYSKGSHSLEGLKYVVFGLGNRTYEHYNIISRQVDEALTKSGATRIGERGEGDDDKSMEEDYLGWKDGMWEEFSRVMGVREGAGADSADFTVTELNNIDSNKVYLGMFSIGFISICTIPIRDPGELSARALNKTKGIHDTKNPFPAPIQTARELFTDLHDRNCVHVEFNVEGSGLTYQHGDHVGIWPSNPDIEVTRLLCALGLYDKRDTVIGIESLDPALAKVPFPVPTTYATVLRHYIDISTVAGRQILNILARFSPNPAAASELSKIGSDKEYYSLVVGKPCLKLGEVLQLVTGDNISAVPSISTVTPWNIPFDVIVSAVPRLQARYYSISSSPKIHPQSIHVTCVVLKYQSEPSPKTNAKWVFGVGSNYLLDLRMATHGEKAPLMVVNGDAKPASVSNPTYAIAGPRNAYAVDSIYKAPIHVRRSTFRLPTNPKIPILMVGPGTVSVTLIVKVLFISGFSVWLTIRGLSFG
jgi:NADPH-ferrihemoprotein reductase